MAWSKTVNLSNFEVENLKFLSQVTFTRQKIWLPSSVFPLQDSVYGSFIKVQILQQFEDPIYSELKSPYPNDFTVLVKNVRFGLMKCNLGCTRCVNSFSCEACEIGMIWDSAILQCKLPYEKRVTVNNLDSFLHVFGNQPFKMLLFSEYQFLNK